jgi:hypothetical protein
MKTLYDSKGNKIERRQPPFISPPKPPADRKIKHGQWRDMAIIVYCIIILAGLLFGMLITVFQWWL